MAAFVVFFSFLLSGRQSRQRTVVSSKLVVDLEICRLNYARGLLTRTCIDGNVPCHPSTGFPLQPRPHDLTRRDLRLMHQFLVSPKIDGRESFFVFHREGGEILFRNGEFLSFSWKQGCKPFFPLIVEGEVVSPTLYVAYDILISPVACYCTEGKFRTRQHALLVCLTLIEGRLIAGKTGQTMQVITKPFLSLYAHPHRAVQSCQKWAMETGIPCDGMIFADADQNGYSQTKRLWKLKNTPTVDFAVYSPVSNRPCPEGSQYWELMLRSSHHTMQSLHRFCTKDPQQHVYNLPVIAQLPVSLNLSDGDVLEFDVKVLPDRSVELPVVRVRERGKLPNFTWAAMDVITANLNVTGILQPMDPILPRVCVQGPLRLTKCRFMENVLNTYHVHSLLEIGGGSGGDAILWLRAPNVHQVDVIEPEKAYLVEYTRRLVESFNGRRDGDCIWCGDTVFRFFNCPFQECPIIAGQGYDIAIMNFSVSQLVGSGAMAREVVQSIFIQRGIHALAVVGHRHDGEVPGIHTREHPGVTISVDEYADESCRSLFCLCNGPQNYRASRLHTHISTVSGDLRDCHQTPIGTTMASGISEFAFDCDLFRAAIQDEAVQVHTRLPFEGDHYHWLLGSLFVMVIVPNRSKYIKEDLPKETKKDNANSVYDFGHREQHSCL